MVPYYLPRRGIAGAKQPDSSWYGTVPWDEEMANLDASSTAEKEERERGSTTAEAQVLFN